MNKDIKKLFQSHGLKQWQVAEAMGISETTLCVWLRHELPPKRLKHIQEAVYKLSKGGKADA